MTLEPVSLAISITTTIIGIIGGSFAVMTYLKNQRLQRQAIILPLMKEFDTDMRLDAARRLLEGFKYIPEGQGHAFDKDGLNTLLRNHRKSTDSRIDPAELKVRESFVALLDFFGKLGYLLDIKVITKKELGYFKWYIYKARNDANINTFAKTYSFELYAVLLNKMDALPETLRDLSKRYYDNERSDS